MLHISGPLSTHSESQFDGDRDLKKETFGLKDLPQHLLELILGKFGGGTPSGRDLLYLQYVSKAWRSAVQEYSGRICIDIEKSTDLFGICKLLPAMSCLSISSLALQYYLHPVSSLSRLTYLKIHKSIDLLDEDEVNSQANERLVDLAILPACLRELVLQNCCVDDACFKHIRCVELTSLDVHWTTNTAAEICNLLQHLPKLKVIS